MLGLIALMVGGMLESFCDSEPSENEEDTFEVPYTCIDEWRSIHPFGYNPVTGCWTKDEEENNGW